MMRVKLTMDMIAGHQMIEDSVAARGKDQHPVRSLSFFYRGNAPSAVLSYVHQLTSGLAESAHWMSVLSFFCSV